MRFILFLLFGVSSSFGAVMGVTSGSNLGNANSTGTNITIKGLYGWSTNFTATNWTIVGGSLTGTTNTGGTFYGSIASTNANLTTPKITGGTNTGSIILTPTITGGSVASALTGTNAILTSPSITGGTNTGSIITGATISGGSVASAITGTNAVLTTPSITGGTNTGSLITGATITGSLTGTNAALTTPSISGATLSGTLTGGTFTNGSFAGTGTYITSLQASNVVNGGQLPIGTVAAGTNAVLGPFLSFDGTNRNWNWNAGSLTNLTASKIVGTITNSITTTNPVISGGTFTGSTNTSSIITGATISGGSVASALTGTNAVLTTPAITGGTNTGLIYYGTATITNAYASRITVNSNFTALGNIRTGSGSEGWTLVDGDMAVGGQLYVGGAGVNSGYIMAINYQTGSQATPEVFFDDRTSTNSALQFSFGKTGTRKGYVGWQGNSSTNNRKMAIVDSIGDGMLFQTGSGGGQNGFMFYSASLGNYAMKLHALGGLAIGSSYYSTAPATNGLNVEGKVGIGVTSPQYNLDVGGSARLTGTSYLRLGGTAGAADDTIQISQSAANILTITASTRAEISGNLNVGFTGSGAGTFHVKSASSRPAIVQSTVGLTSDAFAYRDQYGYYLSGIDALAYLFQPVGAATNRSRAIGTVTQNVTSTGNTGASETNLVSYTTPAGGLAVNGDCYTIKAFGNLAANANSKTIKVKFGSAIILNSGAFTNGTDGWRLEATVVRTSATNQVCSGTICVGTSMVCVTTYVDATEALAGTVNLVVTGTGAATSDIIHKFSKYRFEPAN